MDPFEAAVADDMAKCNIDLDELVRMSLRKMERTGEKKGSRRGEKY